MSHHSQPTGGVLFDLDGTLVSSALDFDAMRSEMNLPRGVPVLEGIQALPHEEAERCWQILEVHERAGCQRANLMPGVRELLADLAARGYRCGLITRNSRRFTLELIERLRLEFSAVVTRDDGPPKPDPAAILAICNDWGILPSAAVMIGDYRFDLEAGRAAGCRTVLYTAGEYAEGLPAWAADADLVLPSFEPAEPLLDWLSANGRQQSL